MATATSLTLRSILTATLAKSRLLSGLPRRSAEDSGAKAGASRLSGLTTAAKALAVAAAARKASEAVVLYVVPGDPDLEAATSDVRFFLGALEGLSEASAERAVLPFPSHQVDPYRGLAPALPRRLRARACAACRRVGRRARRRRVGAGAAARGCRDPESIIATSFDLRPGIEIDPLALAEILVEGGYERQDPVDEHGEFSLRGGILDVYPAGEDLTGPHRVHRGHGGVDPPVRPGDPALDRNPRSVPNRSGTGARRC